MATAQGWTNRGLMRILAAIFNGATLPTNFYLALLTDANVPGSDTNLFSDVTEIAAGNGYTAGGYQLSHNSTDFPNLAESDANDYAIVDLKDVTWTASGGSLPSSGSGARYAILTDDNATQANREVWAWWDLSSARSVTSGQDLTIHLAQLLLYSAGTVAD